MLFSGPLDAPLLLLAHGAGAGMDSPFMCAMADALATRHIRTLRFEFSYMRERRTSGKRRPPPRAENLVDEFKTAVGEARAAAGKQPLYIGGKSMGGRIASLVGGDLFEQSIIAGTICIGYPFHPPGKPEKLRTQHLEDITAPILIVQGERDPFGRRDEIPGFKLDRKISFAWMTDGDHDLKPRRASGFTHDQNIAAAADSVVKFVNRHQA